MAASTLQPSHTVRLVLVAAIVPLIVGLAVLAFAWPSARIEPRNVAVGVVGTGPASQRLIGHVSAEMPGAFQFRVYPSAAAARTAIEAREVYGAFSVSGRGVELLEATAGSPSMAEVLQQVAEAMVAQTRPSGSAAGSVPAALTIDDVVPSSPTDPRGAVFGSCMLPLTICSMIAAAAVALLAGLRSARWQLVALVAVALLAGAVVYLVGQVYLGAFPHASWADWMVLALTEFAISSSTSGLVALVGAPGLGLGAALMVCVANPFSAATSAPQLLPGAVDRIGQLLPPGAGASALRSTAYFSGHGLTNHALVLIAWALFGIVALAFGRRRPLRPDPASGAGPLTSSPSALRPVARRGIE